MSILAPLPVNYDFNQIEILKKCNLANKKLAELKGICHTIPNSEILINTLSMTEAKSSSHIENIITTYNDLCKEDIDINVSGSAKEVKYYIDALKQGYQLVKKDSFLITRHMIDINNMLQNYQGGLRNQSGTVLKNDRTGEVVYTPPQHIDEIQNLLKNLEQYINEDHDDLDHLIKMAIIHHQFESIHPFFDGNGRTGRIINVLYLVIKDLIDIPILYISRYIIQHKDDYYRLLQAVRENGDWTAWVIYMLSAVEETATETINQILAIKQIHTDIKTLIKQQLPKLYSRDLVDNLFLHPYTKIDYIQANLNISRQTASSYLNKITEIGILDKVKLGTTYYFVNKKLFATLLN